MGTAVEYLRHRVRPEDNAVSLVIISGISLASAVSSSILKRAASSSLTRALSRFRISHYKTTRERLKAIEKLQDQKKLFLSTPFLKSFDQ